MKRLICFFLIILLLSVPIDASALSTSAKSAILINGATGEVIYEQNADLKLSMASTTKIMTAVILCEYGNFDKEITVTPEMLRVEGSSMGLIAGDRVTLHDLLYGLMLASGNDAANVIAYTLAGNPSGFSKLMNSKAKELGMNNTNFVTPSGLDCEEHYTTARDMATLTVYAMKNEDFKKAVSSESATLNFGNPPYKRSLSNHNKLLKTFDGAVGVKTGFTKKSGRCLVSAAERDGKFAIAVTLNDPNDWQDHTSLLEYGLNAISTAKINPPESHLSVPVISGEKSFLNVFIAPYTATTSGKADFGCEIELPKFLYAPVKCGDVIGEVIYKNGDNVIHTTPLLSDTDIALKPQEQNFLKSIKEIIKYILLNIWVK